MSTAKNDPLVYRDTIKLSSIVGVHVNLKKAMKEFGYLADGPFPVKSKITQDAILALLDLIPIHVTPHSTEHYWVFGGFRSYALAKHLLPDHASIPVLVNKIRVNQLRMERQFAIEYCLLPLMMDAIEPKEMLRRMSEVEDLLPGELELGSRKERAELLGLSVRSFASLSETT
jgi:hypothetical protein